MTSQSTHTQVSGAGAMLRLVGILTILALAALGCLVVLGALSLDTFTDLALKVAMLAGISGTASIVVWALTQRHG